MKMRLGRNRHDNKRFYGARQVKGCGVDGESERLGLPAGDDNGLLQNEEEGWSFERAEDVRITPSPTPKLHP